MPMSFEIVSSEERALGEEKMRNGQGGVEIPVSIWHIAEWSAKRKGEVKRGKREDWRDGDLIESV
jgi:hypothetical protein